MIHIKSVNDMQKYADECRAQGKTIGFVPTMGYLHEGHLSLMHIAKQHADVVVTSIYVNPTQFGPNEDFEKYPRDLERDAKLARDRGTDVLFVPTSDDMYPQFDQTVVTVKELTTVLCGKSRSNHFQGVTTVVTKLLNAVKPNVAVFGQKDAQQALVIKRMVADLFMDIDIVIAPIVREDDGLAKSSRNVYLTAAQREQAVVLRQALLKAQEEISFGKTDAQEIVGMMRNMIKNRPEAKIDYVNIVSAETLKDIEICSGEILIALAVYFGKTRLIDNILISVK